MFKLEISKNLLSKLKKIKKKNILEYKKIKLKMEEIMYCDENSIDFYKNLKYDLKNYKRVHIVRPFVLIFRVDKIKKIIFFEDYDHHDKIYESN